MSACVQHNIEINLGKIVGKIPKKAVKQKELENLTDYLIFVYFAQASQKINKINDPQR